ncbi:hypothetical protein vseg_009514 [Gypsophila vaccaria]
MEGIKIWMFSIIIMSYRLIGSEGIWMNLPSDGSRKCLSEEIQNNVVVLGDYVVIDEKGHSIPTINAKVTSPYGNQLYHQENITYGQFAFTANEIGNYVACFWVASDHQSATLNLEWKIGFSAKDWDSVAKKEHLEGLELELRKLEGTVEHVLENLIYLQQKEWGMREVSEKTNARVAWYGLMSIGIGITASIYQVWHLRRYFQKRKLI